MPTRPPGHATRPQTADAEPSPPAGVRRWWTAATGALGAVLGLLPHLLHHVGVFAGTALVAGVGGTLLFGVLGLAAAVPMLIRLHRRFRTWWAPGIALVVFAAMFTVSTLVLGPALRGDAAGDSPGGGSSTPPPGPHVRPSHHS